MSVADHKIMLMSRSDFKTVIVGSSTAEVFEPCDIDYYLKTKSFIASTGGASATTRYGLIRYAIDHMPQLEMVVYIADIYEFKEVVAKTDIFYNFYLYPYLNEVGINEIRPSFVERFQDFLSHQQFESATTVLKKYLNKKNDVYSPNGQMSSSIITSPIIDEGVGITTISKEIQKELMLQIHENFYTYSHSVLNDFTILPPAIKQLYADLIRRIKEKKLKLVFLLSPYHPTFKKMLFELNEFPQRYNEWVHFLQSFHDGKNIFVINQLEEPIVSDETLHLWRDGIHYFRPISIRYLKAAAAAMK